MDPLFRFKKYKPSKEEIEDGEYDDDEYHDFGSELLSEKCRQKRNIKDDIHFMLYEMNLLLRSKGHDQINHDFELAFRLSCSSGYIERVKLIYPMVADITFSNCDSLTRAIKNGNIEVIDFFYPLMKKNLGEEKKPVLYGLTEYFTECFKSTDIHNLKDIMKICEIDYAFGKYICLRNIIKNGYFNFALEIINDNFIDLDMIRNNILLNGLSAPIREGNISKMRFLLQIEKLCNDKDIVINFDINEYYFDGICQSQFNAFNSLITSFYSNPFDRDVCEWLISHVG